MDLKLYLKLFYEKYVIKIYAISLENDEVGGQTEVAP